MKPVFVVLFFAFAFCATGQTYEIKDINSLSDQYKFGRFTEISFDDDTQKNYEGTPFFNEDFSTGDVVINDTTHYQKIPLRYNIYTDKIQFRNNQGRILEFNLSSQKYIFTIEDHRFVNKEYRRYNEKETGILEILAEGKISLYKKYGVVFKQATREAGFKPAEPNRFKPLDDKYLIAIDNTIPEAITLSKKLLDQLEVLKPGAAEFARSNKIKLRSEKDLIRLIEYCNQ